MPFMLQAIFQPCQDDSDFYTMHTRLMYRLLKIDTHVYRNLLCFYGLAYKKYPDMY